MKVSLYKDDFETEKIFSYLRWIVILAALIMFYFPGLSERLYFESKTIPYLFLIGIIYMSLVQIAFMRPLEKNKLFQIIVKTGILFDYITFYWLLIVTGGISSYLFPIAYLIIMHATIYWRTRGAILSTLAVSIGYVVVLALEATRTFDILFIFTVNMGFIWIVGLLGSMIVIRERMHIKQKEIFKEMMGTDYLTGLQNHRSFQEQLRLLAMGTEHFVLALGDIDYFKCVNDNYGHIMGDKVLKSIGIILREIADDYLGKSYRYGGEEFAFLLPEMKDEDLELFFADLYARLYEQEFTDDLIKITMSFGVSTRQPYDSVDQLLNSADHLLYNAKSSGKNRAIFESGSHFINKRKVFLDETSAGKVL